MNKQKILQDFLRKAQQNGNKEEPRKGEEVFDMGGVQIVVPKAKDGYSPIKGKDFFTPQEVEQFKKDVTPVYKKDYLTPDELESIAQQILVHATPQKGIHYEDGKDGISPDPNEIAKSVLERIPAPDLDAIASIAVTKIPVPKDGKDGKDANPKVVIDAIKKLKGNDRLDISNIRNGEQITQALAGVSTLGKKINTLDERWHGGGGSGTSVLLETNGTKNSSQTLLNLVAGTNISLSDSAGAVTINAGGDSNLTVGVSTIASGTNTYLLYDNNGVLGEINQSTFQGALTLTTTGTSGAATLSGNTLNIPQYAGTTYTFTSPLVNTSGTITITQATTSTNGYLSSTDWNTFNNKQGAITLTTTGTSGAATFSGGTLNIPQYAGTTYTAGTGLTLTSTTFSVNTSQNITTLSNLTVAGFVQTTSGGLLSSAALTSSQVTTALGFTPIANITGLITAGTNITITGSGTSGSPYNINATSSSTGIVRSVNSISTATTAGASSATDYVYLVTGTTTLTLPTAVSNTNLYTIKRVGTNTVTVATTSAQTIDGASTYSLLSQYESISVISDGNNWNIV